MRYPALLLAFIAISCSQTKPQPAAESAPPTSTTVVGAPDPTGFVVPAEGEPYALRFSADALNFCDKAGAHKLDLESGQPSAGDSACVKSEPNTACAGLSLDVTVRNPSGEPNDIVDVGGSSFALTGHVQDCAVDGKLIGVVTASTVVVIDTVKSSAREIDKQGGDRVAISGARIAWTDGPKVHLKALKK